MEQLTYLLFLKMADERSQPPCNVGGSQPSPILKGYDWPSLLAKDGDELIARDKASLDIFWLKDDSLADSDKLPPPDAIAQEIVDDHKAAPAQFRLIAGDLGAEVADLAEVADVSTA